MSLKTKPLLGNKHMIQAMLKGKLSRKQENMEDILTSIVLGSIEYFPPKKALLPFLAKAELASGKRPFKDMEIASADYEFWPKIKVKGCNGCEPDALITLSDISGNKIFVMVEAKYRSGKSSQKDESDKPNDQLAREWDNLYQLSNSSNAKAYLVYLTSDFGYPTEDMNESLKELIQKNKPEGQICWLSWRHFPLIPEFKDAKLLMDISEILRTKLNLIFFEGFSTNKMNLISWNFTKNFKWSFANQNIIWSFKI